MKLTDEEIQERSERYGSSRISNCPECDYGNGAKDTRDIYESMFDSELAILLSRHVHDRCGDNVPHDIGLTLLELIKNYKKG